MLQCTLATRIAKYEIDKFVSNPLRKTGAAKRKAQIKKEEEEEMKK